MELLENIQAQKVPTKRHYIYEVVRRQLLSQDAAPGSRLPTSHALAKRFGVSYVTMHSALSDLVRDGFLVRHKGKGTFVAMRSENRSRRDAPRFALVLPVQEDIAAAGSSQECFLMFRGCMEGAASCGANLNILFLPSFLQPPDIPSALQETLQYDGALFFGNQYDGLIRELSKRNFPVVVLGVSSRPVSQIQHDGENAIRLVVNHLLEHGFRRIGFFGISKGDSAVVYLLFSDMLQRAGISLDGSLVQDCSTITEAYPLAQQYLHRQPRPEAVFVDNHVKAWMLISAAQNEGLNVPGDLKVIGHGAENSSASSPSLSMAALPYESRGREGVLLLDKLRQGLILPPTKKILPVRFIIGQSCGCCPVLPEHRRQTQPQAQIP